ncbi:hypothetical protein [Streptomyces canus]|uniref:hypothetical protein n=1 Tax=Streptomyces canus TaxID=58343 RepID=UPI0027D78237|nr:hypothetical protein [Streptomyces canus]
MSWMRGLIALLAVCVVLVTGSVSCGASGAQERKDGQSVSPVGKVLDDTDEEGRHYREVDKDNAPDVGIQVQPNSDDSWSVRLTIENFTFSPAGTKAKAVSGRGVAVVFVDDRPVTTLRAPSCRLAAAYVPQGTHKVTARLYADDGTVWAVDGDPVESTADVTASEPQPTGSGGGAAKPGSLEPQDGSASSRVTTGAGGELPDARVAGAGADEAWTLRAATDTGGGVSVLQAGTRAGGGVSVLWAGAGSGGGVAGAGADASAVGGDSTLWAGARVSGGVLVLPVGDARALWTGTRAGGGVSVLWAGAGSGGGVAGAGADASAVGGDSTLWAGARVSGGALVLPVGDARALWTGTRAGGGVSVLWAGAGSGGGVAGAGAGAGVSSGGGVTELRVGAGVSDGVSEARVATSVGGGR